MFINDFESTLRYSQLCKAIDNADTSIVSNGTTANYTINFDIPLSTEYYVTGSRFSSLAEHTFESSPFLYNGKTCYIKDSTGILNIVTELGDSTVVVKQIGRIDYDTGVATITSFNPQSAPGGLIKFYAVTRNKDIFCRKNVLLSIAEQDITINVERVRE
jgi:hypothetical protein